MFKKRHILNILPLLFWAMQLNTSAQNSFEFVVLPDTQTYMEEFPEVYKKQMEWIANREPRFAFVLHVGDITQNNSEEEWKVAKAGFSLLHGKVPYNLALGNHDMGSGPGKFADTRNTKWANTFFPYGEYISNSNTIATFPEGTIDNSCAEYHLIGEKWLVFSLEFGPRNQTLDWANTIIKQHPQHKIILNTHAYLYDDSTLHDGEDWYLPQKYGVGKETGENAVNDGSQIWKKLIAPHKNSLLVFSGHILGSGVGTLVSKGIHGNMVYQMLANYQKNVKGFEKGDSGYLRIIKIDKKSQTISVQTYSPWLDKYLKHPDHEFVFTNANI